MARERIRQLAAAVIVFLALAAASAQTRAFEELYPGMDKDVLAGAMAPEGLSRSCTTMEELRLLPSGEVGKALKAELERRGFGYLSESLSIVRPTGRELPDKLGLYNAISQVRSLSGITYRSSSRKQESILFDEVTRIAEPGRDVALPDGAESSLAPRSGFFVRLKDANFGTSYYRMDFDSSFPGILFSMRNARALSVFMIPVLAEGEMFSFFYLEPTLRGLAIYTLSGARVGGFAASQVDIPSALRKRVAALRAWLIRRVAG